MIGWKCRPAEVSWLGWLVFVGAWVRGRPRIKGLNGGRRLFVVASVLLLERSRLDEVVAAVCLQSGVWRDVKREEALARPNVEATGGRRDRQVVMRYPPVPFSAGLMKQPKPAHSALVEISTRLSLFCPGR